MKNKKATYREMHRIIVERESRLAVRHGAASPYSLAFLTCIKNADPENAKGGWLYIGDVLFEFINSHQNAIKQVKPSPTWLDLTSFRNVCTHIYIGDAPPYETE